jgi:glycine/D-amino acid oxidase-like deaminating enzyme
LKAVSQFDYLIVGQGLSGTCLAITLENKYKKKVAVVDRDSGIKCSRVAAGTFNPVAFKVFSPTWGAAEFVPFLKKYFGEISAKWSTELIRERPVFKTIKSEEQRNLWKQKSMEMPSSRFMEKDMIEGITGVKSTYGFGVVKSSGNLHMIEFLDRYRDQLQAEGRLSEEEMSYEELVISDIGFKYRNFEAKKLVFCQGHENEDNPFFNELPFRQTKGEVLIIRVPDWCSEGIVHNKINIVPMGNDVYWAGSSFDWHDKSTEPTEKARLNLLDQLKETLSIPFEVIRQEAGIRPTVIDRRPILGEHPDVPGMYIFNGMGTRGVMLAPYFANEMTAFMEEGKALDPEIDLKRFNG